MRFEVAPQALTGQAPVLGRQGGRLAELAGEVRGLADAAGATGVPEAAAALEQFARTWSGCLLLAADSVAALGAATGAAATAYTAVDTTVMPTGR
jgi:hypothetical protein